MKPGFHYCAVTESVENDPVMIHIYSATPTGLEAALQCFRDLVTEDLRECGIPEEEQPSLLESAVKNKYWDTGGSEIRLHNTENIAIFCHDEN